MKKAFFAFFAVSVMSTAVVYAVGGKKKEKNKAKTECTKNCTETKDCHKNAKCPNKPGCICE